MKQTFVQLMPGVTDALGIEAIVTFIKKLGYGAVFDHQSDTLAITSSPADETPAELGPDVQRKILNLSVAVTGIITTEKGRPSIIQ